MAFTNEYTISFADAQNRANIVYLDLEGGDASATALTPAEDPLTYIFGNDGDDEYRALNPTALEIRVKVDSTAAFDEISGSASLSWRVRWNRGGSEVWRGYLLTDEIEQPFDLPSILTLRAVCGLKELDGIVWDTATAEDSFVDHAATILAKLGGHANDIKFQANWHAYNGGSAVTGNSYSRYTFDSAAFNDPLDSTKDSVCSVALENIAGRFGGKIFFADGDWWMVQRDLLAATYTPDVRAFSGGAVSTGSAVSVYTLTDAQIYSGAVRSNAPAYYQVPIVYYHYPQETGFFLNGGFEDWTGSVPDNWTEFGGGGNLTRIATTRQTVFVRDRSDSPEYETTYACEVHSVNHSGTDYGSDSVNDATVGIYQESQFDVNSTSHKVVVSFDAGLTNQASSGAYLDFFYAIWLNTSGTDYYWDATSGAWTSGTLGATAGKMRRKVTNTVNSYSVETGNLPASSGRLRVYLYNVVDKGSKVPTGTGIIYDNFKVGYNTGDRSERVKTAVTATNANQTSGLIRSEQTFFVGQGPSALHTGAIKGGDVIATLSSGATWDGTNTSLPVGTSLSRSLVANDKILVYTTSGAALMVTVNANVSAGASPIVLSAGDGNLSASILSGSTIVYGWMVENWKAGSYAGAEASSGRTLDYLHANEILDQRGAPTRRLRLTFRPSSGSYWPYMPLSYESKTHSCVSLRYSARFDEYSGEWLAVDASGVSITLEEEYGDDFVRPTDFIKPIDEGRFGPRGGGITLSGMGGPQVVFTAVGDSRARFPRASVHSTDPTNVLANNYFSGTVELSASGKIETPDYATSGGVYIDYTKVELTSGGTVSKLQSGILSVLNAGSSHGITVTGGAGTITLQTSGNSSSLVGTGWTGAAAVDLSFLASTTGDLTVGVTTGTLKFRVATGVVLSMPQTDGSANQVLKTDGSGNLDWVTQSSGVTTFLGLTDTPSSFSGTGTYFVKVNAGANALEFVANPGYLTSAVTSVAAGIGLDGGTITSTGTISLSTTFGTADAWPTTLAGFDGDADYVGIAISSFGSTLIDDADASAARSTLGLGSLATASTINGGNWSGTDLALTDGGTGASLSAPGADRILFYDQTALAVTWLAAGDGIAFNGTNLQMDWSAAAGSVTPYTVVVKDGDTNVRTVQLGSLATASTINNSNWSGADLALANGGTGASLSDPNADRIMFWDDSAGVVTWLAPDGDVYISNTSLYIDNGFNKTLLSNISDVAVTNTVTETTMIAATVRGSKNLAASSVQTGTVFRLTAKGYYTTGASGEVTLRWKLGGVTITSVNSAGASGTLGASATGGYWEFNGVATVDTAGASGNVWCQGSMTFQNDTSGAIYTETTGASTVSSSINFNSSATWDVTCQWTVANASNSFVATTLTVETLFWL